MSTPKLLLDEDVRRLLADVLVQRGFDAVSVGALGMGGTPDPQLLRWATRESRAILTHNVADFTALAEEYGTHGWEYAGIIVSDQIPFRVLLLRILRLLGRKSGDATSVSKLGTLNLGTLGTTEALAVLQALESDTDTKILARPKILTLDNESAIIRLTADEAIGFETSSQSTTGTQTAEPERTTTGVLLVVTPQVNEHGYITMLVEPSVTKTVESNISPPSGQATPRDPKTRSSRTLVRIRSGDTLVVGGLIDRSEEQSMRKVPILSGVPFLGEAFKNQEVSNSASELIVFITPRLLEEATAAQVASIGQTPLGLREQESTGAKQEAIEETLNQLER